VTAQTGCCRSSRMLLRSFRIAGIRSYCSVSPVGQMPFGCPRQIRHKRVASRVPQHGAQWQSRQTVLIYQDPGTENPICRALCTKSADPLTPPPHRPSAHFPHRSHQDPRGFLLPRFVNAGRHLVAVTVAPRPASKNLQDSRLSLQELRFCFGRAKAAIHNRNVWLLFLRHPSSSDKTRVTHVRAVDTVKVAVCCKAQRC
jgi:hypothetical protein